MHLRKRGDRRSPRRSPRRLEQVPRQGQSPGPSPSLGHAQQPREHPAILPSCHPGLKGIPTVPLLMHSTRPSPFLWFIPTSKAQEYMEASPNPSSIHGVPTVPTPGEGSRNATAISESRGPQQRLRMSQCSNRLGSRWACGLPGSTEQPLPPCGPASQRTGPSASPVTREKGVG